MNPAMGDPTGNNADDGATTWLDVEAWNDEARQLCDHVAKGRQIMVTGRLKENVWTDKATGQRRSRIKVSAYSFAFVALQRRERRERRRRELWRRRRRRFLSPNLRQSAVAAPQQQQQRMQQQRQASATMMGGDVVGEKDDLWREVLDNPDAWWDNRERKNAPGGNPRYPDFKHKETQTPLWIESRDTPRWAIDALVGGGGGAMMAAGVGAGGFGQSNGQVTPGRTRTALSRTTRVTVPPPAAAAATATSRGRGHPSITRDRTATSRTNPRSPSTTMNPRSESRRTIDDDGSKDVLNLTLKISISRKRVSRVPSVQARRVPRADFLHLHVNSRFFSARTPR